MALAIDGSLGGIPSLLTPPPPFPSGIFNLTTDWFELNRSGVNIVRSARFETKTQGSFFTEIEFLGDQNGKITLVAKFQNCTPVQKKYLIDQKFPHLKFSNGESCAETCEEKDRLFVFLKKHNEILIPPNHNELILKLISNKNWTTLTPVQAGQPLPPFSWTG